MAVNFFLIKLKKKILNKIKIHTFVNEQELSSFAGELFFSLLKIPGQNNFVFPGGTTPKLFFNYLNDNLEDWTKINIIPSDERIVDEKSNYSNIGMIKKHLYKGLDKNNYPNIFSYLNESDNSSQESIQVLKNRLLPFLPIKAAFLGIGSDGHTASIFDDYNFDFKNKRYFDYYVKKGEEFYRATISAYLLTKISKLIFLIYGKQKRDVFKQIIYNQGNIKNLLPVSKIINQSKKDIIILCDDEVSTND